jgi:hypothetical protein
MDLHSFFSVSQYTCDIIVVPCYMSSTISTPFFSKKTVAISILADNIYIDFFSLFINVCASIALTALWFQPSQMKPRFHHLCLMQCDWEIHRHLCGIALKRSKPKEAILCILWAFSELILLRTCDSLAKLWQSHRGQYIKSVEIHANCETPPFTNFFGQHFEQDHHSLQMAGRSLRSSSWTSVHLPIFEHSTPLFYGSFTYYILTMNRHA